MAQQQEDERRQAQQQHFDPLQIQHDHHHQQQQYRPEQQRQQNLQQELLYNRQRYQDENQRRHQQQHRHFHGPDFGFPQTTPQAVWSMHYQAPVINQPYQHRPIVCGAPIVTGSTGYSIPPVGARSPGDGGPGGLHVAFHPGTPSGSPGAIGPLHPEHPSSAQHSSHSSLSSAQSHLSLPSLNNNILPPIRNIEAGPPQTSLTPHRLHPSTLYHHHQAILNMGTPLPPPMQHQQQQPQPPPSASQQQQQQQQMSYYAAQALPPASPHMAVGQEGGQLRYPLPPDNRMMSAQRHKKDIKRRTKTGCMTCRKRRIKCDEGQPDCRNCLKSKRKCGYDPIFKAQPGHPPIQPAPNAEPSQIPTTASPYPQVPAGYMPAGSPSYSPAMGSGPSNVSGPPSEPRYANASAMIDPALEALPGATIGDSPLSTIVKPCKIEEILNVGQGSPPPHVDAPQMPSSGVYEPSEEVHNVYASLYAVGIDKLLETKWFSSRSYEYLRKDALLCEKYKKFISRFNITATSDYPGNLVNNSFEMHIIWDTMQLCRQVSTSIDTTNHANAAQEVNDGVHEAAKRLDALEALFTNNYLDSSNINSSDGASDARAEGNPTAETAPKKGLEDQLKGRERRFWRLLSKLLCIKDELASPLASPTPQQALLHTEQSSSTSVCPKIDAALQEMRGLLDSRENRDILYSVAVARYMPRKAVVEEKSGRAGLGPIPDTVGPNDEENPRVKIEVARNFVKSEAAGRGTTQVFQRVCGMAVLMWTRSKDM